MNDALDERGYALWPMSLDVDERLELAGLFEDWPARCPGRRIDPQGPPRSPASGG